MPPATVLPEPELLVTTGTSLLGLNPTPGLVPAGERAKWICAACVDRVTANKRIKDVFMGICHYDCLGCWLPLVRTQPCYNTPELVKQVPGTFAKPYQMGCSPHLT